ncbi:MAG TPA: hypothetical protein VFR09_02335, partial [Alphaproteobacteria bacterium]|nr:hypothetical protein [Alphaproteobacteria bacterium]
MKQASQKPIQHAFGKLAAGLGAASIAATPAAAQYYPDTNIHHGPNTTVVRGHEDPARLMPPPMEQIKIVQSDYICPMNSGEPFKVSLYTDKGDLLSADVRLRDSKGETPTKVTGEGLTSTISVSGKNHLRLSLTDTPNAVHYHFGGTVAPNGALTVNADMPEDRATPYLRVFNNVALKGLAACNTLPPAGQTVMNTVLQDDGTSYSQFRTSGGNVYRIHVRPFHGGYVVGAEMDVEGNTPQGRFTSRVDWNFTAVQRDPAMNGYLMSA